MRVLIIFTLDQYCRMVRPRRTGCCEACGTRGGDEKFWLENLKGGNHLRKLGVNGRIILKFILE
jgi:hypothetical protein